jgi:hypothetical protein
MTELLRRWVNDEVKVSRNVKNFDVDFCNGFLFGEVLSRYGLLDPQVFATKFTNDHTPGCKLGNFTQVGLSEESVCSEFFDWRLVILMIILLDYKTA